MAVTPLAKEWRGHKGVVMNPGSSAEVLDCIHCGFAHLIPIPTEEELGQEYQQDYYTQEKPLYLERYREDLEWWDTVYTRRYELLEQHLPAGQRSLLDIGSGPGFFLLNGQKRGWRVKGIEPSIQAAKHSRGLGLDVDNVFFSEQTTPGLGTFDAINMGEVLEHISDPAAFLVLAHRRLNAGGMVCIIVPNDFNPFQLVLRDHLGFKPWWIVSPHHINYFNLNTLSKLVRRCGFEVLHTEATFPIDMFLLMGDNYIGNDTLGRECHTKRMHFERALGCGAGDVLSRFYQTLAEQGLGREIVLYARKAEA